MDCNKRVRCKKCWTIND
ncbi:hypothetical protein E0F89_13020 [Flavobacterium caseinilyticum]|uniref:Uncharacterized protein n=1 Tax=Flavobacterium caseinilyticum TaxID=2541732 RepID=A0A4V2YTV8_9FLAO|nr:hypothetical protein E0F89_13020 [Flavobacterium caseinilyticum]